MPIHYTYDNACVKEDNKDSLTGEIPAGAYCRLDDKEHYFSDEHAGLVIQLREWSDYWDSDFYAVVWDDEDGKPFKVTYDTTRCGFYPAGDATTDASPEIKAKYEAYQKHEARKEYVEKKLKLWNIIKSEARELQLTFRQIKKLREVLEKDYWDVYKLLVSMVNNRLRSEFRKSMAKQVWDWIHDDNPKYDRPLSWRQLEAIKPRKAW